MKSTESTTKILRGILALLIFALMIHFKINILWQIFTAILIAIALIELASYLQKKFKISYIISISLILFLIAMAMVSFLGFFAYQLYDQFGELVTKLQEFFKQAQGWLQKSNEVSNLVEKSGQSIGSASLKNLTGVFTLLGTLFVVAIIGIFISITPKVYQKGLRSFCVWWDDSTYKKLEHDVYEGLKKWLKGKLIAMVSIAIATFIGLSLIGVEYALALALIAGLFSFIPNLGPMTSAVPALIVASFVGVETVVYVALLFIGIQIVEGNLLMPIIEKEYVEVPPALTITLQVFLGMLFGVWGLIVAAPLTVVLLKSWPILVENKD